MNGTTYIACVHGKVAKLQRVPHASGSHAKSFLVPVPCTAKRAYALEPPPPAPRQYTYRAGFGFQTYRFVNGLRGGAIVGQILSRYEHLQYNGRHFVSSLLPLSRQIRRKRTEQKNKTVAKDMIGSNHGSQQANSDNSDSLPW
jgi:hypothetical protein